MRPRPSGAAGWIAAALADALAGAHTRARGDKSKFWSGDYYNTLQHKKHVYRHPNVITLDKLPAFLKAPQ